MTAADRPSVTDNARADLHPVVTEHQIIGTQTGKQGAGQVVPEDSVLCTKCGWMRCSDYTWHLSDALAAGRAETTTATETEWTVIGKDDTPDEDEWIASLDEYTREEAERYRKRFGGSLASREVTAWTEADQ